MQEYRELILAACPNKTGDKHFLEKGLDEIHGRLTEKTKAKKLINCSHMGMLCMKDCPKPNETEGLIFKDLKLSNNMVLIKGQVLYGATDTRNKSSQVKYDWELAKLMVPTRLSPSGPVKGTKSAQPQRKKNFQQPSPKSKCGNLKKSRNVTKVKTKAKKTEYVTSSIPNPLNLLAAYSKNKKKVEFITTPNIPTSSATLKENCNSTTHKDHTKPAAPTTAQRPTMPLFAAQLRKRSGWKYFGPGLHGGAPPKRCLDSHVEKILQESGQEEEESIQEAPPSTVQTEASISMATPETYGRTEDRPDTKVSHVFKGNFALLLDLLEYDTFYRWTP